MPDLISVGRRRGKEASDLISTLFPSPSPSSDIFPRAKLCIRPRFSRSPEKKNIPESKSENIRARLFPPRREISSWTGIYGSCTCNAVHPPFNIPLHDVYELISFPKTTPNNLVYFPSAITMRLPPSPHLTIVFYKLLLRKKRCTLSP